MKWLRWVLWGVPITILALIFVPMFIRQAHRGELTTCESNEKNIGTALEMYYADHDKRFPKLLAQLTPKYLNNVPTCPYAKADTYSHTYRVAAEAYSFYCEGRNHFEEAGVPANFPQYTSVQGLVTGH